MSDANIESATPVVSTESAPKVQTENAPTEPEVQDISGDGGVLKKILAQGSGDIPPADGSHEATVHYTGRLLDGTKFDSSVDRNEPFKFVLGQGQVIKGWDLGVATMKVGEKALLTCRSDYAYGDSGSPPKIPGGATLQFEVELISFGKKEKREWEYTAEEKLEATSKKKEEATSLYRSGEFKKAQDLYEKALKLIEYDHSFSDEQKASAKDARLALHLNIAACGLKTKDYGLVIKQCNKALEIDPKNVKGLFRRAQARSRLGDLDQAKVELVELSKNAPGNTEVLGELAAINKKIAESAKKEKRMFGNMFAKLSAMEEEELKKQTEVNQKTVEQTTEPSQASTTSSEQPAPMETSA